MLPPVGGHLWSSGRRVHRQPLPVCAPLSGGGRGPAGVGDRRLDLRPGRALHLQRLADGHPPGVPALQVQAAQHVHERPELDGHPQHRVPGEVLQGAISGGLLPRVEAEACGRRPAGRGHALGARLHQPPRGRHPHGRPGAHRVAELRQRDPLARGWQRLARDPPEARQRAAARGHLERHLGRVEPRHGPQDPAELPTRGRHRGQARLQGRLAEGVGLADRPRCVLDRFLREAVLPEGPHADQLQHRLDDARAAEPLPAHHHGQGRALPRGAGGRGGAPVQGAHLRLRRLRPLRGAEDDGRLRPPPDALPVRALRPPADVRADVWHAPRGARDGGPQGLREGLVGRLAHRGGDGLLVRRRLQRR
mmetsp:Transcript_85675/g.239894  ORF Transcript_85675/g.239894 Transcript_85675/m.239894 type:complete len:364 (+) Transcript_85675:1004-2095(+)